jgi:hypothetical protein
VEVRSLLVKQDDMKKAGCLRFSKWALLLWASPVQALTINVTYDSSVTSLANAAQVQAAFATAAQTFQSYYLNPITVNLTVYWGNTGPFSSGIGLGASITELVGTYNYSQLSNALRNSRSTAADTNSFASLPASDPIAGNSWWVPRAEAKALGLSGVSANDPDADGEIGFASDVSYTFDATNRAVAGKYDFIGVAQHEISETMGRIPGLNFGFSGYVPYDLFRFAADGARSFDPNANSVYFSVDNGVTPLRFFNASINGGDIQDWASGGAPDAFDAFSSSGIKLDLSAVDLMTLDVIGYKLLVVASPLLTGTILTNGSVRFSFTNAPGINFTALASTDISLAAGDWTVLGAVNEISAGQFQFTDPQPAGSPQRFYRVRSP